MSTVYLAHTDENDMLVVQPFRYDLAKSEPAELANDFPDVIYFEVEPPLTRDRVRGALHAKSDHIIDFVTDAVIQMGATSDFSDLEGAIIEDLITLIRNHVDVPALTTGNLELWRAVADRAGIEHDGETI